MVAWPNEIYTPADALVLNPVPDAAVASAPLVEAPPQPEAPQPEPVQVALVSSQPTADSQLDQAAEPPANEISTPAGSEVLNPVPDADADAAVAPAPLVEEPPQLEPPQVALVSSQPAADSQLVQIADPPPNEIYVQAGAFDDFTNANRVASRLAFAGARISRVAGEEGTIFRVWMGPFQDVATADTVLNQVQSAGLPGLDGEVVQVAVAPPNETNTPAGAEVLNLVLDTAVAPAQTVEALPQPAAPQEDPVSSPPEVEEEVIQIADSQPSEISTTADSEILNPLPDAAVAPAVAPAPAPAPIIEAPPPPGALQVTSVSSPPGAASQVVQIPIPRPQQIYIQAGAFDDFTNANRVASGLAFAGARISRVAGEEGTIFRVRMGPFQDEATADAVLNQVQTAGHTDVNFVIE